MRTQTFIDFIESNFKKRMKLMQKPEKARGTEEDRFANFRRFAEMENEYPAYTAMSKCNKQFLDIMDMLKENHPEEINLKYFQELVNDVHIYLDFALGITFEDAGKVED